MALGSPSEPYAKNTPPPGKGRRFPFSRELTVGLGAALLGFVLSLHSTQTHSVNGVITQCSYTDFAPLFLGPAAAIAGIIAMIRCRRPERKLPLELGLGALCVVLCAVHILRGIGIIGGPCP